MLNVLSIQSDILGHRTYCGVMRETLARVEDLRFHALWYTEKRNRLSRVVRRLGEVRVPVLANDNRDLSRARSEWAMGQMSNTLAANQVRNNRFDVLHFHTQVQAFGALALMRRIPSVITIDMTSYQVARERGAGPRWTFSANILMEHRVFRTAAHIVTMSEWARQSVIEDHGIAADRVTAIAPGVDFGRLGEPDFRAKPKRRILFVGNDFRRKGGYDLLEVFVSHFSDRAELHLMTGVTGLPSYPAVFVHQGIAAYSPEWHKLYATADILVLPSYNEAFGLVLQEGGAYGLALISSRINAITEIVQEGETGLLIEPGDKAGLATTLARLLDDDALLMRLRRTSREQATQRFDAQQNFNKLAEVFRAASLPAL